MFCLDFTIITGSFRKFEFFIFKISGYITNDDVLCFELLKELVYQGESDEFD